MNILILGSGGREHALAWKISQSKLCRQLFIAPGNAGTSLCGINVPIQVNEFDAIKDFCLKNDIHLLVVGPEGPLVEGITDNFRTNETKHIGIIGPSAYAAQLEGSKAFAKKFMQKYDIPTAAYLEVTHENLDLGFEFLDSLKAPYVLKADGLAAGKGVLIIDELSEAKNQLNEMLSGKFGKASETVVIEEFLSGIEFSVFALTDGKDYILLPEAKDYKRVGEGDTGLNTGGMGAISPVPFVDKILWEKVIDRIVKPTIEGISAEKMDYTGFVFFGFLPTKSTERSTSVQRLQQEPRGIVLLEAPHRIRELAQALATLGDRPVTLARELTKQFEEIATQPAHELAAWLQADLQRARGEFVVLVHPATISTDNTENLRVLRLLLEEVPLKSAVRLAAAITGAPRNSLYNSALTMRKTLHAATENTTETD